MSFCCPYGKLSMTYLNPQLTQAVDLLRSATLISTAATRTAGGALSATIRSRIPHVLPPRHTRVRIHVCVYPQNFYPRLSTNTSAISLVGMPLTNLVRSRVS